MIDYLGQKIGCLNADVSILLDNIDPLKARPDLLERLEEVIWKANWLLSHFKGEENE